MKKFQISFQGIIDVIDAERIVIHDGRIDFVTQGAVVGVAVIAPGMIVKEVHPS